MQSTGVRPVWIKASSSYRSAYSFGAKAYSKLCGYLHPVDLTFSRVGNELFHSVDFGLCPRGMIKIGVSVSQPADLTFSGGALNIA